MAPSGQKQNTKIIKFLFIPRLNPIAGLYLQDIDNQWIFRMSLTVKRPVRPVEPKRPSFRSLAAAAKPSANCETPKYSGGMTSLPVLSMNPCRQPFLKDASPSEKLLRKEACRLSLGLIMIL